MADPYLSSDESVLLAADKVLFRSVCLSALVLTNRRILMIRAVGETLTADEILLSLLRTVKVGTQGTREPVLELSYLSDRGDLRLETLAFPEKEGKSRAGECTQWADTLTRHITPSQGEAPFARIPPSAKKPASPPAAQPAETVPSGTVPAKEPGVAPPSGGILAKHDRPSGLVFPKIPAIREPDLSDSPAPAPRRTMFAIAALIIAIIAILAVVLFATQYLPSRSAPPAGIPTAIPSAAPTEVTSVPPPATTLPAVPPPAANESLPNQTAPAEIPTAMVTPAPSATSAPPQLPVPDKGIWVFVQYSGNFTGSVGMGGTITPVSGTGNHIYQISMKYGTAKAIIGKGEGSSDRLSVAIYRDGVIVQRDSTTVPHGEVNIQVEIAPPPTTLPTLTANTTVAIPAGNS